MTDHENQFRRYCAGFLSAHHICAGCESRGSINLANRVHLMRPRTHPYERLTLDYCTPLCTRCYSRRARSAEEKTAEYAEIGG